MRSLCQAEMHLQLNAASSLQAPALFKLTQSIIKEWVSLQSWLPAFSSLWLFLRFFFMVSLLSLPWFFSKRGSRVLGAQREWSAPGNTGYFITGAPSEQWGQRGRTWALGWSLCPSYGSSCSCSRLAVPFQFVLSYEQISELPRCCPH